VSGERLTLVAHLAPPFTGGITSAVEGLCSFTRSGPDGVAHIRIDTQGSRFVDALTAVTVVHCHHALRWPEALSLAQRLGVPAVKTVHILQARQSRLRSVTSATRSERLQAQALVEADRLTIATHAARALLLEDHPALDPERVIVLPLAPRLPVAPRASDAHVGPIVAATRFDPLKGTDLLIEVVAQVLREPAVAAPSRQFVIAGGLPDNARAEARWRDAFMAALTPEERPRLTFSGWLGEAALAELLARAALYVTTSRLETCGLGLMEAVAAGCPVVATDLAVHREVAGPHAHYAAADAHAFARAIDTLLSATAVRAIGRVPDSARVAQDWLHFWAQTR